MHEDQPGSTWAPDWVLHLGIAVWVSGSDRKICYVNRRAEMLLSLSAEQCLGRPCFEVIKSRTPSGIPFCRATCPILTSALESRELAPYALQIINARNEGQWLQVLPIPATRPGDEGPSIVHCALSADRTHRMEEFLHHVASRTGSAVGSHFADPPLTPREREILKLLAEDKTLHAIADRLCVSYTTIRNHVQHIHAKLGVHSTMEAVAQFLLDTTGRQRVNESGSTPTNGRSNR